LLESVVGSSGVLVRGTVSVRRTVSFVGIRFWFERRLGSKGGLFCWNPLLGSAGVLFEGVSLLLESVVGIRRRLGSKDGLDFKRIVSFLFWNLLLESAGVLVQRTVLIKRSVFCWNPSALLLEGRI
jgi:hypothetical protein